MKARKRNSNDEWKDIVYVQLRDSYCLTSANLMEFQHDNLSTELKTNDQIEMEKHWQDVRERAAIAALNGILSNPNYKFKVSENLPNIVSESAVIIADALVKQLKEE